MQADFSVELGAEDDHLELPWSSPDGTLRYYDLKRRPDLLLMVEEAHHNQQLGEFLAATNSANSILETAKCDTWLSNEISEEEQVYGGGWKFGSYVDLLFSDGAARFSFEEHEHLAAEIVRLLKLVPEISAAAEFIIRRCYFKSEAVARPPSAGQEDAREGFYLTFYLQGFGSDEQEARQRWNIGMKVVENALLQLSAMQRRAAH